MSLIEKALAEVEANLDLAEAEVLKRWKAHVKKVGLKHLPGGHDQSSHGSWARGSKDAEHFVTVYHATHDEFLDTIKRDGLRKGESWHHRPPSVYFFTDKEEAINFAPWWLQGEYGYRGDGTSARIDMYDFALVEFRVPESAYKAHEYVDKLANRDFETTSAHYLTQSVPPDWLSAVEIYTWGHDVWPPDPKTLAVPPSMENRIELKADIGHPGYYIVLFAKPRALQVKHQAGGHDQKTHGSWATGSSSSSEQYEFNPGTPTPRGWKVKDSRASNRLMNHANDLLAEYSGGDEDDDPIDFYGLELYGDLQNTTDKARGIVKGNIVANLRYRMEDMNADVEDWQVNDAVGLWAETANDNQPAALQLQEAAAAEFAVPLSHWQTERSSSNLRKAKDFINKRKTERIALHPVNPPNPVPHLTNQAEVDAWAKEYEAHMRSDPPYQPSTGAADWLGLDSPDPDYPAKRAAWEKRWKELRATEPDDVVNPEYVARLRQVNEQLRSTQAEFEERWPGLHYDRIDQQIFTPSPFTRQTEDKAFVRAMYQNTQESLSDMGYNPTDTITLYRGVGADGIRNAVGESIEGLLGERTLYRGNVLESWSLSPNVARSFADKFNSAVISMKVPVSNIVSTYVTGTGCLIEEEVVVLGSVSGQIARLAGMYQQSPSGGNYFYWSKEWEDQMAEVKHLPGQHDQDSHGSWAGRVHSAHEIAGDPDLYNKVVRIGRSEWECMGYSKTGNTVKFGRLIEDSSRSWGLRQIVTYLDPDAEVVIVGDGFSEPEVKHLPGQHDQTSHGSWARGGGFSPLKGTGMARARLTDDYDNMRLTFDHTVLRGKTLSKLNAYYDELMMEKVIEAKGRRLPPGVEQAVHRRLQIDSINRSSAMRRNLQDDYLVHYGLLSTIDKEFEDYYKDPWHIDENWDDKKRLEVAMDMLEHNKGNFVSPRRYSFHYENRAMIKHSNVTDIAEEADLEYGTVNKVIGGWAETSNHSFRSLQPAALQQAVAEEFDVKLSPWQQKQSYRELAAAREYWLELQSKTSLTYFERDRLTSQEALSKYKDSYPDLPTHFKPKDPAKEATLAENRKIVRAMYNQTQETLAAQGYRPDDTVTLYRGVGLPVAQDHALGSPVAYQGNAIESWSFDVNQATKFSEHRQDVNDPTNPNPFLNSTGYLLAAEVPVRSILSLATTGFGCFEENEIVIFGSILGSEVYIRGKDIGDGLKYAFVKSNVIIPIKHRPGGKDHNQKTHGSWATGSSKGYKFGKGDIDLDDLSRIRGNSIIDVTGGGFVGTGYVSDAARGGLKNRLVTEISDMSGLDYYDTNELVAGWAKTSNDSDERSKSMQEAAAEEFGVPLSEWQQRMSADDVIQLRADVFHSMSLDPRLRDVFTRYAGGSDYNANDRDTAIESLLIEKVSAHPIHQNADYYASLNQIVNPMYKEIKRAYRGGRTAGQRNETMRAIANIPADRRIVTRAQERKFLAAMYQNTQTALHDAGYNPGDRVRLWRGFIANEEDTKEFPRLTKVSYKGNAIEAWSSSHSVARAFGVITVGIDVPVENMLSVCTTGFGCLNEYEFVVMGSVENGAYVADSPYEIKHLPGQHDQASHGSWATGSIDEVE